MSTKRTSRKQELEDALAEVSAVAEVFARTGSKTASKNLENAAARATRAGASLKEMEKLLDEAIARVEDEAAAPKTSRPRKPTSAPKARTSRPAAVAEPVAASPEVSEPQVEPKRTSKPKRSPLPATAVERMAEDAERLAAEAEAPVAQESQAAPETVAQEAAAQVIEEAKAEEPTATVLPEIEVRVSGPEPGAGGGWENALSTKLAATRCVFCKKELRNPESIERGIGPECADKFGWEHGDPPTEFDEKEALQAFALMPPLLRRSMERLGGSVDDKQAAWRTDPWVRKKMVSSALYIGALAVSFGANEVSVVKAKIDSSKAVLASLQQMASAFRYTQCAQRLATKYVERLEGNAILFQRNRAGQLGVYVPKSEVWVEWCRGNRSYFLSGGYDDTPARRFFRYFDESKLGFVANALRGSFGDTICIDEHGKMVPLPTMHVESEDHIAPAEDVKAEDVKVVQEVQPYAVPETIKLGDMVRVKGADLPVLYIDPGRQFVGLGKKPGRGYLEFLSYAQVKQISGREIARDLYQQVARYSEQIGVPPPPPPTAKATARPIPVLADGATLDPHQVRGVEFIDGKHGRVILADEMGLGKGLVYGTKVLTPTGWVAVESLKVGDQVIDPDGGHAEVKGVFPQPRQPVFRVALSDGTALTVDAPHLWHVYTPNDRFRGGSGRVMSTEELLAAGLRTQPASSDGRTARKWMLPLLQPARFAEFMAHGDRTWAPYALGALLGDGSFGAMVTFSKPDEEVVQRLASHMEVRKINQSDDGACPAYTLPGAKAIADALGLSGLPSEAKFIPEHYRRGPVEDRMELLRGLMDTDGDCAKDGTAVFNTSSAQLRDDMIDLVRGLGGVATVSVRQEPKYTYNGETKTGLPAFRVNVRVPFNPFHLRRKAERWTEPNLTRGIETIEPAGEAETVCISVSSKRKLFVAEDYIVTHNTITATVAIDTPAVVVCPANLKVNWMRELLKWKPGVSVSIVDGRTAPAQEPKRADVIVISYDVLGDHAKWLSERKNKTIVADEAHYLKELDVRWKQEEKAHRATAGSPKRARAFYSLQADVPRVLLLTGTPVMNRTKELFPLLHMVDPGTWSSSYNFCIEYCGGQQTQWGFDCSGRTNSEQLFKRVNDVFMLRRTVDVLNLPPKRYEPIAVVLSDDVRPKYQQQARDIIDWVLKNGGPEKAASAEKAEVLVQLTSLRQTAAEGKADAAVDWIKQHWISTGRPLVVMATSRACFARMKAGVDRLNREYHEQVERGTMPDMQAPIRFGEVVGGMGSSAVTKVVDQFQGSKLDLVFYSISLAVGTTLTRAQDMLFVERAWRPADLQQAEARIFRRGQKNNCCFTYMDAEGTIDQKLALMLKQKAQTLAGVMHGVNLDEEDAAAFILGEMFLSSDQLRKNPPSDPMDTVADSWAYPL